MESKFNKTIKVVNFDSSLYTIPKLFLGLLTTYFYLIGVLQSVFILILIFFGGWLKKDVMGF
tara:strand:+ start:2135 stop:2320 length:186 start_codon:yes stop_codon:yes gene_type:complete